MSCTRYNIEIFPCIPRLRSCENFFVSVTRMWNDLLPTHTFTKLYFFPGDAYPVYHYFRYHFSNSPFFLSFFPSFLLSLLSFRFLPVCCPSSLSRPTLPTRSSVSRASYQKYIPLFLLAQYRAKNLILPVNFTNKKKSPIFSQIVNSMEKIPLTYHIKNKVVSIDVFSCSCRQQFFFTSRTVPTILTHKKINKKIICFLVNHAAKWGRECDINTP